MTPSQGTSTHGSSRKSSARNSIETDYPQPGSAVTPTARPDVSNERSEIFINEDTADFGRSMKRKGSVLDSYVEVGAKRRKSADPNYSPQDAAADHAQLGLLMEPRAAAPPPSFVSDAKAASPEHFSEIDDIDSFTVDMSCPEVITKRKTPPRKAAPSSRKHKQTRPISVPQPVTADHSPYVSLIKS